MKYLEDNATDGHHDSIWKALSAIELLLVYLEKMKTTYKDHLYLNTNINLVWKKLEEYYKLMYNSPIYTAVVFL